MASRLAARMPLAVVALVACIGAGPACAPHAVVAQEAEGDLTLEVVEAPVPEDVPGEIVAAVRATAVVVSDAGAPAMRIWWATEVPVPERPSTGMGVEYGHVPPGAFLGILQLDQPRVDFRAQTVPAGVYAMRYLQQPADGAHIGVTPFRDFVALTPVSSETDPYRRDPEAVLNDALTINTHPFVWALWPADQVSPDARSEPPQLTPVQDYTALTASVARTDADPLVLVVIVEGNAATDMLLY